MRLSRQAKQLTIEPRNRNLRRNVVRAASRLENRCPGISDLAWGTEHAAEATASIAEAESRRAAIDFWQKWCNIDDTDDNRFNAWVKGDRRIDPPVDSNEVTGQQRVQGAKERWSKIWTRDALDPEGVDKFMDWIPEEGYAAPELKITGKGLQWACKRARGTAAGTDRW